MKKWRPFRCTGTAAISRPCGNPLRRLTSAARCCFFQREQGCLSGVADIKAGLFATHIRAPSCPSGLSAPIMFCSAVRVGSNGIRLTSSRRSHDIFGRKGLFQNLGRNYGPYPGPPSAGRLPRVPGLRRGIFKEATFKVRRQSQKIRKVF